MHKCLKKKKKSKHLFAYSMSNVLWNEVSVEFAINAVFQVI